MDAESKKPKFEFQLEPLASGKLLLPPRWIIKGIWPRDCMLLLKELPGHVSFTPKSGHPSARSRCPLSAISGHPSLDHFVGERPGNERL